MWIILAALSFLGAQIYLFRCLNKLDGILEAPDGKNKKILSIVLENPVIQDQMCWILEEYSAAHPDVDLVLHTDPGAMDAVLENRADIGFCPLGEVRGGLSCLTFQFPGEPQQLMIWKRNDSVDEFAQYLWQVCGK